MAEHFKPYGGVNNLIRQAKAKEKEAGKNGEYHWPNGAIVTFDSDAYGYVPTGIWSGQSCWYERPNIPPTSLS